MAENDNIPIRVTSDNENILVNETADKNILKGTILEVTTWQED